MCTRGHEHVQSVCALKLHVDTYANATVSV